MILFHSLGHIEKGKSGNSSHAVKVALIRLRDAEWIADFRFGEQSEAM
jgi:hypothetical protein